MTAETANPNDKGVESDPAVDEDGRRYITVNLDLDIDGDCSGALMVGPFDTYAEAQQYGDRRMQLFGVNTLSPPAE